MKGEESLTSCEHQGTLAVVAVVVVVVSGAEAGAVRDQAALPAGRAAVASQVQPEREENRLEQVHQDFHSPKVAFIIAC